MSAQGPKSVSSPFLPKKTVFSGDASDYIKRLKQTRLYQEYSTKIVTTGSTTAYNNAFNVPVDYTIAQSNDTHLLYAAGQTECVCIPEESFILNGGGPFVEPDIIILDGQGDPYEIIMDGGSL